MNKPILYKNSNALQRSDIQQVLNEFSSVWKWRQDGRDTILDVGCGSGDTTMDLIVPILPENFECLVGCDVSDEMLNYARNTHIHPKISFEHFDLNVDVEMQSTALKSFDFDHITSFYCLMWVQNQRMVAQNLYKLLKPGGDLLVIFVVQHPIYNYYKKQSQDDRWSEYMADVDEYISPYQYSNDPVAEFRKHLSDSGFKEFTIEVRERCYVFNGVQIVRNFSKSINPFIDRLPIRNQETYLEDLVQQFVENDQVMDNFSDNSETCRIAPHYKQMVAYARK